MGGRHHADETDSTDSSGGYNEDAEDEAWGGGGVERRRAWGPSTEPMTHQGQGSKKGGHHGQGSKKGGGFRAGAPSWGPTSQPGNSGRGAKLGRGGSLEEPLQDVQGPSLPHREGASKTRGKGTQDGPKGGKGGRRAEGGALEGPKRRRQEAPHVDESSYPPEEPSLERGPRAPSPGPDSAQDQAHAEEWSRGEWHQQVRHSWKSAKERLQASLSSDRLQASLGQHPRPRDSEGGAVPRHSPGKALRGGAPEASVTQACQAANRKWLELDRNRNGYLEEAEVMELARCGWQGEA